MKKFKHLALLLLAAVMVFGCSKYDDTELRNDVSDLQSRVTKLEEWCETANGQITSLQGLVTTLQNNDYVTGVTPVMEGTTEVGYTISFTKSSPITIMHGTDGTNGKDGSTPIIGVKKHTDDLYYWTIQTGTAEATWMEDAQGNMIPTTGKDGEAGQKPAIGIAKDGDRYYWQVDGQWLADADGNKVPATGDKGEAGAAGDSFFKSVTPDAAQGTVVIKLANDTEFTLPMLSTTVSFDAYTPLQIAATGTQTAVTVKLPASLKKADFAAIKADITNVAGTNSAITRAGAEKWTVALTAPTFKTDGTLDAQPTLKVTVPATATTGETALLEVTVVDTKGNKSTSTRVLYYDTRVLATGVTLDKTTATVKVGKTEALTATIAPNNATNKNVTWTSSDATIATVADGTVTGVKAGTATITATAADGSGVKATCAVTVENIAVTKIELAATTISIGAKKTLTPTFTPTDATIKAVTWSSSNTAVATVNATTGEVEGIAVGEVTITATSTEYTSIKGTCKVTVTAEPSDYIEVNGIKVAVGNLVADGEHGAKIGAATDYGLFFQFGSLVGWSGGANGDGVGETPTSPALALAVKVTPTGYTGSTTWDNYWGSDPATENAATGTGDPCKYYLKGDWRLPTKEEYAALFKDHGYPSTGPWKWDADSKSAKHIDGLTFPAAGYRGIQYADLNAVGENGYYWNASLQEASFGNDLYFSNSNVIPGNGSKMAAGHPVRCIQDPASN